TPNTPAPIPSLSTYAPSTYPTPPSTQPSSAPVVTSTAAPSAYPTPSSSTPSTAVPSTYPSPSPSSAKPSFVPTSATPSTYPTKKPHHSKKPKKTTPMPSYGVVNTWEQCGGKDYTGSKTCRPDDICVYVDEWYSQCLPTKGY
ncbi:hypothetical protein As57867_025317, partial [Aphanomyces stellatus]